MKGFSDSLENTYSSPDYPKSHTYLEKSDRHQNYYVKPETQSTLRQTKRIETQPKVTVRLTPRSGITQLDKPAGKLKTFSPLTLLMISVDD
jgi:hypothetical protein